MNKKRCTHCGVEKDLSEFPNDKRLKSGIKAYCKTCQKIVYDSWRQKNKDKIRVLNRRWASENPEKCRASEKKYRQNNPDKSREWTRKWHLKNLESVRHNARESMRIWRKDNPEKMQTYHSLREAKIKNAPGTGITPAEWRTIKNETDNRCVYCGKKFDVLEIDHVEPLTKGGRHDVDNIVPACKSCNSSKGNRTLLRFFLQRQAQYGA